MRRMLIETIKKKLGIGRNKDNFCIRIDTGREVFYAKEKTINGGWIFEIPSKKGFFKYWDAIDYAREIYRHFDDDGISISIIKRGSERERND